MLLNLRNDLRSLAIQLRFDVQKHRRVNLSIPITEFLLQSMGELLFELMTHFKLFNVLTRLEMLLVDVQPQTVHHKVYHPTAPRLECLLACGPQTYPHASCTC